MATSYQSRLGTSPEEGTKAPVWALTTSNISLYGIQNLEGITGNAGKRIAVAAQDDATENGVYDMSVGVWERSTDFNDETDIVGGVLVPNNAGGVFANSSIYMVNIDTPKFEAGVTEVTFTKAVDRSGYGDADVTALNLTNGVRNSVGYATADEIRALPYPVGSDLKVELYGNESGVFVADLLDSTSPEDTSGDAAGNLIVTALGVRYKRQAADYRLEHFGAICDGFTDDSASVADFEASVQNKFVDLQGKVCSVTTRPNNNYYYNGRFLVAGVLEVLKGSADGWFYDPDLVTVTNTDNVISSATGSFVNSNYDFAKTLNFSKLNTKSTRHVGLLSAAFEAPNGDFCVITREAFNHGNDTAAKIVLHRSRYGGREFAIESTAILDETAVDDRDFAFAQMDSNRLGLVVSRLFAGLPPVFIYSDNFGYNWTAVQMPAVANNFGAWFGLHKYPSSAGGSDSGGWICYGTVEGVHDGIHYAATVDNGLTWTSGNCLPAAATHVGSEPTICRIGDADKWFMIYRDNRALRNPALISYSDDMLNWSAPVEAGFLLGKNPPYLYYRDGYIYMFAAMRDGGLSAIKDQNKLVYARTPAYKLLAQDTSDLVDSNLTSLVPLDNMLGYFTLNTCLDGSVVGSIAYGERADEMGNPGLTLRSNLCLISDTKSVDNMPGLLTSLYTIGTKVWSFVYDKQSTVLTQIGHDIELSYSTASGLSATITFPHTFELATNVSPIPVWRSLSATNATPLDIGNFRVDLITASSCRVTLFNTSSNFIGADTALINLQVSGYKLINDV